MNTTTEPPDSKKEAQSLLSTRATPLMKRQLSNGYALQLNPQTKEQFRVCTTAEIPEQKMTSTGFVLLQSYSHAVLFTGTQQMMVYKRLSRLHLGSQL